MTAPVVEAGDLEVAFGGHAVLHGVDFKVDPGEFVVLLGANGSGKTTLIRALLGLVTTGRGWIEWFGSPLRRFRQWGRIGYVPQRSSAATGVPATVEEVVLSGRVGHGGALRGYGKRDRIRAVEAVAKVGLSSLEKSLVTTLSGGQQQRVLIARALAGDPEIIVLDEPLAGVDLPSQDAFAETLGLLNREGKTVLLVAHELGALESLVSRAVVLRGGHVSYEGPPLDHHVHEEHVHHHPHIETAPETQVEPPGRGFV